MLKCQVTVVHSLWSAGVGDLCSNSGDLLEFVQANDNRPQYFCFFLQSNYHNKWSRTQQQQQKIKSNPPQCTIDGLPLPFIASIFSNFCLCLTTDRQMEICSPSPAFQLISLTFILLVYLFPNLTSSSPYSLSHPKVTFPTTKYCSPTIQMRLKLLSLLIRVWGKGQIVKISRHLVKRVLHPE